MSSVTFGQKRFIPTPPDKGSFPLDHENVCKLQMIKYMSCLKKSRSDNAQCRIESKDYLQCRMDNGLMAREEWKHLGLADVAASTASTDSQESKDKH